MTPEQKSGLIPALQLLLGDCTDDELHTILASAFNDRVNIVAPLGQIAITHHVQTAINNTDRLVSGLLSPPLGKLACENLQEISKRVIESLRKIHHVLNFKDYEPER